MKFRPGARRWISLGIVVTFLSAAGCAPAPDQARYTVAQYRADKALRKRTFAECTNDPGTYKDVPDCVNAIEAERLEGVGSLRDLPPLRLPGQK